MRALAFALLLGLAAGCASPVVEAHVHEIRPGAWQRLVVTPFQASLGQSIDTAAARPETLEAADAAVQLARQVSEAFGAAGFDVVPASDLTRAYAALGETLPLGDAPALAARAAREFGATAVLLGSLHRYRAREGGELGATRPASVGFTLVVHAAPGGEELWSARFDHRQRALSEDVFGAPRYPGGGTRWLSAAELSRWGAENVARRAREQKR